ncbi:MAG: arginase family protein [Owenweeksia sp.]|nr:arginase family protein [Owenweeksia sp.]
MGKELQVLSVMSELGAGTRGASLGYEALKIASIKSDIKFFTDRKVKTLPTENHLLFEKDFQKTAVRLTGIAEMYAHIEEEVAQTINKAFPLVITGDHSNAGGTIAGIKKANPDKRLGVVWVDAHSDLHSPYTTPTGNIHGMPLATALGMDNLENQKHPTG